MGSGSSVSANTAGSDDFDLDTPLDTILPKHVRLEQWMATLRDDTPLRDIVAIPGGWLAAAGVMGPGWA